MSETSWLSVRGVHLTLAFFSSVIGPSGVGKSTVSTSQDYSSQILTRRIKIKKKFINTAAGKSLLRVNDGLDPCTTRVEHVRCTVQFEGSSKNVVFVDTPAFGSYSGLDVEMKIQKWLRQT